MTLGARIKEERQRLGLNQTAFAALAGAGRRAMVNWEADGAAPLVSALIAWADYGADALYILTGRRTAEARPDNAVTQIEDQLADIRRDLLDPNHQRLTDETEGKAEERAVSTARNQLRAMLQYDRTFLTPEMAQEVEHLLDIAENPASLALYRAADNAQMRKSRRDMRDRIAGWFNPERYTPNDTVLNTMVATVLEHGVPHRQLVDLVEEVFDDAANWYGPREKAPA